MSRTAWTACILRVGFLATTLLVWSAPSLRAELLLFYSFDDASNPLVAVDDSGQGNDGVLNGNDLDGDLIPDTPAVYTEAGMGHTGGATDRAVDFLTMLEGTWLDVPSAVTGAFDTLMLNDAATIAMWIYGSDLQPVNQWDFWFGPNRQLGCHIPWGDGTIYFDVAGCCGATQRIQQAEPDSTKWKGQWNHYAFVKEQTFTRIYQNGVLWLEGDGKDPLGPITEVFFGAGDSNHTLNYNGLMDDIGVWDEALSEEDIQNVMENGIVDPPKAVLVATPSSGAAPLDVSFDATGSTTPSGTITQYMLTFGDGDSSTEPKTTHRYGVPGLYKAKLIVTDSRNVRGSTTKQITVGCAAGSIAPWESTDVGDPTFPGCAELQGDCLKVIGGGDHILFTSDQFQFVHQEKSGDAALVAQIKEVITWGQGGRAGVMFRTTADPDSPFAMMAIRPGENAGDVKAFFATRRTVAISVTNRAVNEDGEAIVLTPPDCWLQVERRGADLIGSTSADGKSWKPFRPLTLSAPAETMLAGFAVTAGDEAQRGTVAALVFCTAPSTGGPVFHRGDVDANGTLQLTDAVGALSYLFTGGAEPGCFDAADADDNGKLELTDAIRILGHLFLGAEAPAPPGPPSESCGVDPTGEVPELTCIEYAGC
jgi:hypothetical protein